MIRRSLLSGLLILGTAAPAFAQADGAVSGVVLDSLTRAPVGTAALRVVGTVLLTFSDDSGRFLLRGVPAGARRLAVERIGYEPRQVAVSVRPGARATLEIVLQPRAVMLGGVVASVTKREASAGDAPVSVSIMDEPELRQRLPATVADAVAYAPSVQFVGENVNIRGSSGYSRGTGSRVLLLLDGVPANAGDSGALNWDVLPLTEVERVEVMKGAGSALYGTSALGGVVNVVTRAPPAEPVTRVRLRAGFYDDAHHPEWIWADRTLGYSSAELSHGRHIGRLGVWLRGGLGTDDGYRQNSDLDRSNFAARFELGGASDSVSLFGSWAREEYGASLMWCVRGQCDDPEQLAYQPLRVPRDGLDDRTRSDKARAYLTHDRRWGGGVSSFERLSYGRNDWETDFGDSQIGAVSDVFGGELKVDWSAASWLLLTLGGEGAYTDVDADLFGRHDLTDVAAYAQAELGLTPWLTLTGGARGDIRGVDGRFKSDLKQLSPRVGAVVSPDALTRIRTSLGRGYRAPTVAELFTATEVGGFLVVPNDSLRPERSWAGEVGVQRLVTSWLALDVAGFFYEFRDLIEADTVLRSEGVIEISFDNLPQASIVGLEAIARVSFLRDRLLGQAAYTFLDTDDGNGEPLAYRPKHLLTASGQLDLGAFELGLDYRYASAFEKVQVFTDPRLDAVVPMRVLDGHLSYQIGDQILRLQVENALNHSYTTIERNLEPIRRYTVSLEIAF
ncbi:MAG: TonB-dependent receptor [Gemmatimonadota bacterium]|nr:MAG: TonB-dependent receptor [Gemmatimonadota bacterium]